jgi:hypothetical protein
MIHVFLFLSSISFCFALHLLKTKYTKYYFSRWDVNFLLLMCQKNVLLFALLNLISAESLKLVLIFTYLVCIVDYKNTLYFDMTSSQALNNGLELTIQLQHLFTTKGLASDACNQVFICKIY